MKAMPHSGFLAASRTAGGLLTFALLLAFSPASRAAEPAGSPNSTASPSSTASHEDSVAQAQERIREYQEDPTNVNKARAQAALASVNADIKAVEQLAERASTDEERQQAEARLRLLKERQNDLRADYNLARIDELRGDARSEWTRFKGWVTGRGSEPGEEIGASDSAAGKPIGSPAGDPDPDTTGSNQRSGTIGASKAPPSADGSTDDNYRKFALARVGNDLAFLEQLASRLDGGAAEDVQARIRALQNRQVDLQRNFTPAGYRSLIEDVDAEINQALAAVE